MHQTVTDADARFAPYVTILGRGPGRSRALTREEARDAFAMVLADSVHPAQLGAFLMLLRYRGEDPDEIARQAVRLAPDVHSVCVHGDGARAVEAARAVRQALTGAGLRVQAFT